MQEDGDRQGTDPGAPPESDAPRLAAGRTPEPAHAPEPYRLLELAGLIVVVLLGFAAFFVSFLVAPVAVILLAYLLLRAMERGTGGRPAEAPQDTLERRARLDRERVARQGASRGGGRGEGSPPGGTAE